MAQTLLRPADDGEGYEVSCPREHEAQIFEYVFGGRCKWRWSGRDAPLRTIGSDPTTRFLTFMPGMDLSGLTALGYDFLPDSTHLLQLEEPEQCAALTVEFLERQGLA